MRRKTKRISQAVVRRLPRYHRYLDELESKGIDKISSSKLAQVMEITASQVRQDLSCFGEFGQHGYGYNVSELLLAVSKLLGIDNVQNVVIIGAGRMGQALASYGKLNKTGFNIVGIFDKDTSVVGKFIEGLEVKDVDEIDEHIKGKDIKVGIICISNNEGQMVGEKLISLGIRAIWNFSPVDLKFSSDVVVENVHLTESLMVLSYKHREKKIVDGIVEKIFS